MNHESNYDTINRSFLIAQNSDRIQSDISNSGDQKSIKILRDPKSKHPLEFSWSFWFFKSNRNNNWLDNLVLLTTVDNVEDFWSVYNYLKPVEYLSDGCDYAVFKKGVKPMWEDEKNQNGGRWLLNIEKRASSNFLNDLWLNALLSLLGSRYDDDILLINGVVLNVRFKSNKLGLWTSSYENKQSQNRIVNRFKKEINLKDSIMLFEIHKS